MSSTRRWYAARSPYRFSNSRRETRYRCRRSISGSSRSSTSRDSRGCGCSSSRKGGPYQPRGPLPSPPRSPTYRGCGGRQWASFFFSSVYPNVGCGGCDRAGFCATRSLSLRPRHPRTLVSPRASISFAVHASHFGTLRLSLL